MSSLMLRVSGRRACFSRPELKVEAVTYDVMTPTAAKAILGSIYWKPEMDWAIDGIQVLNPVRTMSIMRNGITEKISVRNVNAQKQMPFNVESMREQRNATILVDVDYIIVAHIVLISHPGEKPDSEKHFNMFTRRASKGQCFRYPYLGCREFSADLFELAEKLPQPHSSLKGTRDLGYMLHSINYDSNKPKFFRAEMIDGYINIPLATDRRVKQ